MVQSEQLDHLSHGTGLSSSILNIPEAIPLFLSKVYFTDKYSLLSPKEAQFFSDVFNIIFLSLAFS